jgi:hypothetical protein
MRIWVYLGFNIGRQYRIDEGDRAIRSGNFTQEIELGIHRSAPVSRGRRDHEPSETHR